MRRWEAAVTEEFRFTIDEPSLPSPADARRIRKVAGLTIEQMAQRVDVSRVTLGAWEAGKQRPSHAKGRAYARALQMLDAQASPEHRVVGVPTARDWALVEQATSLTLNDIRDRPTISVPEAGAVLGIGRDAAYAAAQRGEIPTLRLGRTLRVPVPKLLAMLEGTEGAVTAHNHSTYVEGCFRCDLSREEAAAHLARYESGLDALEPDAQLCHCGEPAHIHETGFTRGLCVDCDAVRCDAYPDQCPR